MVDGLEEQLAASRKEKAAVDVQLTEVFFSFGQMKIEWCSKESDYRQRIEGYMGSAFLISLPGWATGGAFGSANVFGLCILIGSGLSSGTAWSVSPDSRMNRPNR